MSLIAALVLELLRFFIGGPKRSSGPSGIGLRRFPYMLPSRETNFDLANEHD